MQILFPAATDFSARLALSAAPIGTPLRIVAAILVLGMLCGLLSVVRHLVRSKDAHEKRNLPSPRPAPHSYAIIIICTLIFAGLGLLLFYLVKM